MTTPEDDFDYEKRLPTDTSANVSFMEPALLTIYTDGACEPNPGPAGCGFAVYRDGVLSDLSHGLYHWTYPQRWIYSQQKAPASVLRRI